MMHIDHIQLTDLLVREPLDPLTIHAYYRDILGMLNYRGQFVITEEEETMLAIRNGFTHDLALLYNHAL